MGEFQRPQDSSETPGRPALPGLERAENRQQHIHSAYEIVQNANQFLDRLALDALRKGREEIARIHFSNLGRRLLAAKFGKEFNDDLPPKREGRLH